MVLLLASLNPSNIAAFGNKALFMGHDTNGRRALWITDGTTNGTQELVYRAISIQCTLPSLGIPSYSMVIDATKSVPHSG